MSPGSIVQLVPQLMADPGVTIQIPAQPHNFHGDFMEINQESISMVIFHFDWFKKGRCQFDWKKYVYKSSPLEDLPSKKCE